MKPASWIKIGFTAVFSVWFVLLAFFVFFIWAHHMFIMGVSSYPRLVFSLLAMLVAIVSTIKIFKRALTQRRLS
jgi:cytochrome c oxidase subunit 1